AGQRPGGRRDPPWPRPDPGGGRGDADGRGAGPRRGDGGHEPLRPGARATPPRTAGPRGLTGTGAPVLPWRPVIVPTVPSNTLHSGVPTPRIPPIDPSTATGAAAEALATTRKMFGTIPNLSATAAHSPAALVAMNTMFAQTGRSSLGAKAGEL